MLAEIELVLQGEPQDTSRYGEISTTIRAIRPKHAADSTYFSELYAETLALHPELDRIIDIIEADDRRLFST
jgi:hypothetical protein